MSQAMTQSDRAVELIKEQELVDSAWVADEGYIIAILNRGACVRGNVFEVVDAATMHDHDGQIEIVTGWLHEGTERDSIHLRTEDNVEACS